MIITRRYARRLIKQGHATLTGVATDNGVRYDVLTRWDYQRIDHVRMDRNGYTLTDIFNRVRPELVQA